MMHSVSPAINPVRTPAKMSSATGARKSILRSRWMLAAACLLVPTIFSATMQCEVADLLRVVIGMVAFQIVLMSTSSSAPATKTLKKVESDKGDDPKFVCADADGDLCKDKGNATPVDDPHRYSTTLVAEAADDLCKAKVGQQPKEASAILPMPKQVSEARPKPNESSTPFDVSIKRQVRPMLRSSKELSAIEGQFSELLGQLEPSAECQKVVREVSMSMQRRVDTMMPGANVRVFLAGPFWKNAPFASSVPDIEMVVSASSKQLAAFSRKHATKQSPKGTALPSRSEDMKWFLRVMVKQLLKDGTDFKWRRSSYVTPEGKVILVAPKFGGSDRIVAFDLSVNGGQPVHNALLVQEASRLHPSVKGLLKFVRRWSKVRGMSQAGLGYLSTYTWTLMVLYFLQVSNEALLPPACCCKDSQGQPTVAFHGEGPNSAPGVASLFESFARFYSQDFDWLHEQICVTTGKRSMPGTSMLCVQDPFRPGNNDLVALVTGTTMARVKQEFELALTLMESEAPLSMLLQQWLPQSSEDSIAIEHS